MQPPAYLIARDLPGALWIMPHPPSDRLSDAMASYAARGIDTIVSMLPPDEASELGLGNEDAPCASQGIAFVSHPIVDFGLPDADRFTDLIDDLSARIRAGAAIAVHCRAGIGRSGMVTACTLIALGHDAGDAVHAVSKARGVSIPDTVTQADFIARFAAGLK